MNMQNQQEDYWMNLFIDSLTGAASGETEAQLAAWRQASPVNERRFAEMKKIWDSLHFSVYDEQFDAQRAYQLFKTRVKAAAEQTGQRPDASRPLPYRRIAAVAAILLPILFLSYFTYRYWTLQPAEDAPLFSEITVPNGSKIRMKLQDGSAVWLNAGSRIRYDANSGKTHRRCSLSSSP